MQRVSLGAVAVALLASGCSVISSHDRGPGADAPWPADVPPAVELAGVPFHPQDEYQCGPAALATLLGASGIEATPEDLVAEVYIPARKGSLQTELLAATRQRERIAYVLEPSLAALVHELAAQRPVLVLVNLGVRSWPIWHYAVVIGYERDTHALLLRSGTTERQRMSLRRFSGAWSRAGQWAYVALRAGELPASGSSERYAAAVADFETVDAGAALLAYEAGIGRWPDAPLLRLGAANALLAQGDSPAAESALTELLRIAPADIAARNNLAELLSLRGCRDAALAQIALARAAAQDSPLAPAIAQTAAQIASRSADPAARCP